MEPFVELLKEVNIAQIFIMFAGGWVFYTRLDKKITDVKVDLKSEINKLDLKIDRVETSLTTKIDKLEVKIDKIETALTTRIDKLSEKVEDIDRRLCRIEGGINFANFAYHQARAQKVSSKPEELVNPQEDSAD